jgi:hypothetical protein
MAGEKYMSERNRWPWLGVLTVVLLLAGVAMARTGPVRPADADQPAGDPGTATDPVFSESSLQQYLSQVFATQNQQLGNLQGRLNLVSQDLGALQGTPGASFPDLSGSWAASAVMALKGQGIISGYPDGNFHPSDRVTRAEMAAMLAAAKHLADLPGAAGFSDVPSSYWANGAIRAAKAAGYLQGYPDGSFRPEQGVTRAEAAVMLEKAFPSRGSGQAGSTGFTDVGSSFWAAGAIDGLKLARISGYPDGSFHPNEIVTRAEAAVMLDKVMSDE